MPRRSRSLILAAAAVLAAVALVLPASASAQAGGQATCPSTFAVLHNDRIGRMSLPEGAYTITLLNRSALSCAAASDLFRQFLEDFDGKLPRPWRATVSTRTFTRGPGTGVGFRVTPTGGGGGGGGGGHHPIGSQCPGTFRILFNERIGTFRIPKGTYTITLLSVGRITCRQAARDLSQFLQDFDGILPSPWFVDPETGSFMRGSRNVGFRIKATVGPPNPNGGGGGRHPSGARCAGTFSVLHNDSIGPLRLPKGPYIISLLPGGGLSCRGASQQFRSFLNDPSGNLPRPWVVNPRSATFTRGRGSNVGFSVNPAR